MRRARGHMAPTAERIKEIQSALAKSGHYSGALSGKWDAQTVEALKRFQQDNELPANGRLTARTLQALGFGSETAGASPPRKSVAANSGASQ